MQTPLLASFQKTDDVECPHTDAQYNECECDMGVGVLHHVPGVIPSRWRYRLANYPDAMLTYNPCLMVRGSKRSTVCMTRLADLPFIKKVGVTWYILTGLFFFLVLFVLAMLMFADQLTVDEFHDALSIWVKWACIFMYGTFAVIVIYGMMMVLNTLWCRVKDV